MTTIREWLAASPAVARCLPFGVFALLTLFQGELGPASRFWIYLLKTVLGVALVWVTWPVVKEMRWRFSWQAVAVGLAVFALWIGLEEFYPRLDRLLGTLGLASVATAEDAAAASWNPPAYFGAGSVLAWMFILVRIVGSSIIVPPLEEVFYRSFLYRSIAAPDFQSEPLGRFVWGPFLITSLLFGVSHQEWLPGIVCGFCYQGLVCWTKRLGDAMTAHAITNAALGSWVVATGAWRFW